MNDAEFYAAVAAEIERKHIVPALWTRAYAEADGDEPRARARYIRYRVAEMAASAKGRSDAPGAHNRATQFASDAVLWAAWLACAFTARFIVYGGDIRSASDIAAGLGTATIYFVIGATVYATMRQTCFGVILCLTPESTRGRTKARAFLFGCFFFALASFAFLQWCGREPAEESQLQAPEAKLSPPGPWPPPAPPLWAEVEKLPAFQDQTVPDRLTSFNKWLGAFENYAQSQGMSSEDLDKAKTTLRSNIIPRISDNGTGWLASHLETLGVSAFDSLTDIPIGALRLVGGRDTANSLAKYKAEKEDRGIENRRYASASHPRKGFAK